ncbi:MAG: oxygen-independent coproporphyrinogen III oxidase [Lachnospiraceae bacterium]|nr:oxygen-independent coproporphyrinogen III oxidase [Lachnospiraceae bacterium]
MADGKVSTEVYIHIPFCVKKCAYCDFLSFAGNEELKHRYVSALIYEIDHRVYRPKIDEVTSVFIGGGTPSILQMDELDRIIHALRRRYSILPRAEITIEVNPGTVDYKSLKHMHELGINRLSIGLQSTNNEELKLLGRIHSYEEFLATYDAAREAGFTNINIDIIGALPTQKPAAWRETVTKVAELKPEHISAYSLIIEEGTHFYSLYGDDEARRQRGEKPLALPTEEEEREMDRITKEVLESYGYHRYEISNYAKEGFECEHNKGYWTRKNYIGFGIGAAGMLEGVRYQNGKDIMHYIDEGPDISEQMLTRKDEVEEYMFLGLRMDKGVTMSEFQRLFNIPFRDVYGETTDSLERDGLIEVNGDSIRLTEYGRDVSNYVLSEYIIG